MTQVTEVTLSSLTANAAGYAGYSSPAFAFGQYDRGYAGYVSANIRSASGILTANFQHGVTDSGPWDTLLTTSLISGTASALKFEDQAKQFKPLLPYGRVTFGLAAEAGGGTRFDSIVAKFCREK